MLAWITLAVYFLAMLFVLIYSLCQLHLTVKSRSTSALKSRVGLSNQPFVTIQLPIYNERYVVERLLRAITNFQYAKECFEIQVLDDSDDQTVDLVRERVEALQKKGFQIEHIRRPERIGFKAGALQYGLNSAKGNFVAIFDADFLPTPDFLTQLLPAFDDHKVGMVQARWGHINKDFSFLTKIQSFGLDAHFKVEQNGRSKAGSFINFNGTAGIWRKDCIDDAGGWTADTLSEDLDLSYRAQLRGWKFKYLDDVVAPAELPVMLPAIRSQQYRWNKGAVESAKKNLRSVLNTDLKWRVKFHAFFHLLNSSVFLCLLIASLISVPLLYFKAHNPLFRSIFDFFSIFLVSFFSIGYFYWNSYKQSTERPRFRKFLANYPLFLIFSLGLSTHNAFAVLDGILGRKTPFVRTPKFNVVNAGDRWESNQYIKSVMSPLVIIEGLLCLYFLFAVGLGVYFQDFGLLIFHLMLSLGFGVVFYLSVKPIRHEP